MPHKSLLTFVLIALITLTFLAASAGASPQFYSTRPEWQAAVPNIITINFTGLGPSSSPWYSVDTSGAGITLSGVNFLGTNGDGTHATRLYNGSYSSYDRGTGDSLGGGYYQGYLTATLPAGGTNALAVDWATEAKGHSVTFTLSSGETYTYMSPSGNVMNFFGFTSDVPITNIQFSASGTYAMIDNFAYGDLPADPTSEPAALLLGATGLVGILLARRLRRYCE